MSRQGVSIGKINSSILKFFENHHSDFNNVCHYCYADKKVMLVFCKYMKNERKKLKKEKNKNKKTNN